MARQPPPTLPNSVIFIMLSCMQRRPFCELFPPWSRCRLKNGKSRRRPPVHGGLFQPQASSPTNASSSSSSKATDGTRNRSLSKKTKAYGTVNVSELQHSISKRSIRSRPPIEPSLTDPTGGGGGLHQDGGDMPSKAELEKAVQNGVFGVSAAAAPPSRSSTSNSRSGNGPMSPSQSREPSRDKNSSEGKSSLSRSTSKSASQRKLQFEIPSSAPSATQTSSPAEKASAVVRKRQVCTCVVWSL